MINKAIHLAVTIIWYVVVGIVCFFAGWLFQSHKMNMKDK